MVFLINQENIEKEWTGNVGKRPKVKKSTIPRLVYLSVVRKISFYAPLVDILHQAWLNTDMNQALLDIH